MKFALAYYLLLIYTTVIIHPLIPLAEDGLSHFFAEAYHIAKVHAIYGNNHLEKQEAAASDNSSNAKNTSKEESTVSVHLAIAGHLNTSNIIQVIQSYCVQSESFIVKIFQSILVPPPKHSF